MIRNRDVDTRRFQLTTKQVVLTLLNYFVGVQFVYPLLLMGIFGWELTDARLLMITYALGFVIGVCPLYEYFHFSLNHFKKSGKTLRKNLKIVLQSVGLIYLSNFAFTILFSLMGISDVSGNQSQVIDMTSFSPLLTAFAALIFAPIIEEVIFRGVFFGNFRSERHFYLPYIVSSVLFGLLHTFSLFVQHGNPLELVYTIQYAFLGFFIALAYERTGSIWGSISVHFINNLVAFIVILFAI